MADTPQQTEAAAKPPSRAGAITRRVMLIGGLTVAGGMAVGIGLLARSGTGIPEEFAESGGKGGMALNAWVRIEPDGTVAIAVPRAEMGQGVHTALAMLVAEELEVSLDQVTVEHPDIHGVYTNYALALEESGLFEKDGNPVRWLLAKVVSTVPFIGTGGSTSVRDAWLPLRRAGAAAREMLRAAAATEWRVAAAGCRAENGYILHPDGETRLAYKDLAAKAATEEVPANPVLKQPSQFKLIGTPAPRVDLPDKVTGKAVFGIDVQADDMLYAAVRHCPVKGGRIIGDNRDAIRNLPGVQGIVDLPNGIAVVADNTWRAFKAADALLLDVEGDNSLSTLAIRQQLGAALETDATHEFEHVGDVDKALAGASTLIEASYSVPYLAHACMEPMNATMLVRKDGSADLWAPAQSPTIAVWAAADAAGVDRDNVRAHITYLGGGFGRRSEKDHLTEVGTVAKAFPGRPVKLTWSREQDMQNDYYRPMALAHFRAGLSSDGKIVAWDNRLASQSVEFEFGERTMPWGGGDGAGTFMNAAGAADQPYKFNNCRVRHNWVSTAMPVGFWRSVGHSQNAFFKEAFLDEVAAAAGADPYMFRRDLLMEKPRHLAVLDAVAKIAAWDGPTTDGMGRGIALHESFHSITAQVADVRLIDGNIKVEKVWCAVDCGTVINPNTVQAQIESAIIYGLTAALYGTVTLENGQVVEENFPDYEMVRMADAPEIHSVILSDGSRPGGIGEVATPPLAPAVANALFALDGKRRRDLPFSLHL